MKRFFVDKIEKPYLTLRGEERRHLADVLRAREGDRVVLCPNDGRDYVYEAVAFDRDSVRLKYIEDFKNETEPTLELTAYISLLKGDKTELAVQKLTELGVHRIVPFVSEYTVRTGEKSDRLRRAAHEASKQCGRAYIPEVRDAISFADMVGELSEYDTAVFAYEGAYASGERLKDVLRGDEKTIALVVGPEGGFSEKEVADMIAAGHGPVTLGKRILRAETASIAGAAVIMQLSGEWE